MSTFDSTSAETTPSGANDLGGEPAAPVMDMPSVSDAAAMPDLGTEGAPAVVPDPGAATQDPPAPQYLDVEQYGNHLVKVKVDGEERELPFSEVRNGLMMQQAFTQRTQQLAEERRELARAQALVNAIEQNPAAVLKELADVYDLDPESGFTPIQRTQQELQFRQMQQQAQAVQQQLAQQRFETEVTALRQEFGQDIDLQPAAKYAVERGLTITDAFKAMEFERLRTQQIEQAEQQRRQQAAAAAAAATHGAGTSQQRGVAAAPSAPVNSIREAFLAAKRAHT